MQTSQTAELSPAYDELVRGLWAKYDKDDTGFIDAEEFESLVIDVGLGDTSPEKIKMVRE
jgi:hypothetical protein